MYAWKILPLTLLIAAFPTILAVNVAPIQNSKELKASIYTTPGPGSDACIRLLHREGVAGCANPSKDIIKGPLLLISATTPVDVIPSKTVAFLPASDAGAFIKRILKETELKARLNGVLIEYSADFPGWNPASVSPLNEWVSRGTEAAWRWNPSGVDASPFAAFGFPIFQLDNVTSPIARQRAEENTVGNGGVSQSTSTLLREDSPLHMAKMQLTMQGTGNTSNCIASQSCLPLGGFSIWSSIPPISGGDTTKDIVLVVASIDTGGIFHKLLQAADNPLSGLIALLAAARDINSRIHARLSKRTIVFAALMGEPWGLMGSRRLLWEIEQGTAAVKGLTMDRIAGVVEIGPIGRSRGLNNLTNLYVHTDGGESGKAASSTLVPALQAAAASTDATPRTVILSNTSSRMSGLPPSSSRAFLKVKPDLAAVVLTEYDEAFIDDAVQTQYDIAENISIDAMIDTAILLSKALGILALEGAPKSTLTIDASTIRDTVAALIDCLAKPSPGFACPFVNSIMTPLFPGPPLHYIDILRTVGTGDDLQRIPDLNVQSDMERFLWNYMALLVGNTTQTITNANSSEYAPNLPRCRPDNATIACAENAICTGYRGAVKGFQGSGVCVDITVKYVPAYSAHLVCDGCNGTDTLYEYKWKVLQGTEAEALMTWEQRYNLPPDPMWVESDWPVGIPRLVMYLQDTAAIEYGVLAAGIAVTVAVGIAVLALQIAFHRRLKTD